MSDAGKIDLANEGERCCRIMHSLKSSFILKFNETFHNDRPLPHSLYYTAKRLIGASGALFLLLHLLQS